MKKLLAFTFLLCGIFGLTACGGQKVSYALDETAKNKEIATEWLNNVSYSKTAINEYKETEAHFRYFLPTNTATSIRLNVVNLESYFDKTILSISADYASTTAFDAAAKTTIAESISAGLKDFGYDAFTIEKYSAWSNSIETPQEVKDYTGDKNRSLAVVYLPVLVERYLMKDNEQKHVLTTYVLCPISVSWCYAKDSEIEGLNEAVAGLDKVSFTVSSSAIQ